MAQACFRNVSQAYNKARTNSNQTPHSLISDRRGSLSPLMGGNSTIAENEVTLCFDSRSQLIANIAATVIVAENPPAESDPI